MARSKRKLQDDATPTDPISYGKDAIDRLTELALHLDLRIHEAKRIGLQAVRLDRIERTTAEILLGLLRRVIDD